jgi:hypothetical protein
MMTSVRTLLQLLLPSGLLLFSASHAQAWSLSEPGHCVIVVHGFKEYDASCNRYYDSGKEIIRAGSFTMVMESGNAKLMDHYGILERGRVNLEVRNEREHVRIGDARIAFTPDHAAHSELSGALQGCEKHGHSSDQCREQKVAAGVAIAAAVVAAALAHEKRHDEHHERMQARPAASHSAKLEGRFDATGDLACSVGNAKHNKRCKFGVHRGDPGSASVHIISPRGSLRILNFAKNNITTPNGGHLDWGREKDGDQWFVGIDSTEFYIVPEIVVMGD